MTEQMKQTFDFKQIGKRMPYRVPNGFFQEMERNVLDAVAEKATERKPAMTERKPAMTERKPAMAERKPLQAKRFVFTRLAKYAAAVAASVVVLLAVNVKFFYVAAPTDMQDVEAAFDQLSLSDQECLVELYQEDVFLDNDY